MNKKKRIQTQNFKHKKEKYNSTDFQKPLIGESCEERICGCERQNNLIILLHKKMKDNMRRII